MARLRTRLDNTLLVAASFIGTIPGALLVCVGLARWLPFALETRFAIGFGLVIPLWATAQPLVWMSKSGVRALLWCLAFAVLGGALAGIRS